MIVTCPTCSARFQYGDERFKGVRSKHFRCPKCNETFEVLNPDLAAEALPAQVQAQALVQAPPPLKATETSRSKGRDAMLSLTSLKKEGMPLGQRFSLAFLTGPFASTARVLDSPVTFIGREEGEIVINDPEISRRHARLEIHGDGSVWITDLDSTNGTLVDGTPIAGPTQLVDRQEFSCGRSTLMLLVRDTNAPGME